MSWIMIIFPFILNLLCPGVAVDFFQYEKKKIICLEQSSRVK